MSRIVITLTSPEGTTEYVAIDSIARIATTKEQTKKGAEGKSLVVPGVTQVYLNGIDTPVEVKEHPEFIFQGIREYSQGMRLIKVAQ